MNRPSIDRSAKYPKVRRSKVKVGDAVTFTVPVPGVNYWRITSGGDLAQPALGYYVPAKKKEDSGRTSSEVFPNASTYAYLIERTASEPKENAPVLPEEEK